MAQPFYKGEEKKFAINIEAAGFDMDTDDFDIKVESAKDSVTTLKAGEPGETGVWSNEDGSLVIFYEEDTVTVPSEEPNGEPTTNTVKTWFCIVDTNYLSTGELRVVATAHIPDEKAYDGVRNSIDVKVLGTLKLTNK